MLLVFAETASAERLPIKSYTTADGLPRDYISRIVQDSKGFLWFCTIEGLSRFDGSQFKNYGIAQGLPSRYVNDFLETSDGVYLVATNEGLCRFDPDHLLSGRSAEARKRFVVYSTKDGEVVAVNLLVEDRQKVVWCGTNLGLFRLEIIDGKWFLSPAAVIHPNESVVAMVEDRQGSLCILSDLALYRKRQDGVVSR